MTRHFSHDIIKQIKQNKKRNIYTLSIVYIFAGQLLLTVFQHSFVYINASHTRKTWFPVIFNVSSSSRPFFSAIAGVDHWSLQLISPHVWGITSISSFLQISCRKMCLRWLYNVLTEWADIISSFTSIKKKTKAQTCVWPKLLVSIFQTAVSMSHRIYILLFLVIFLATVSKSPQAGWMVNELPIRSA